MGYLDYKCVSEKKALSLKNKYVCTKGLNASVVSWVYSGLDCFLS